MINIPKYSLLEIERRMFVDSRSLPDLRECESRLIEDRYFQFGRLRLRKISEAGTPEPLFKLCKKYGETARMEEPIVNVYLSAEEYGEMLKLPGNDLIKTRYRYEYGGTIFSIDAHTGCLSGLFLIEKEAASSEELEAIRLPPFAIRDVTEDRRYCGASLAKIFSNPDDQFNQSIFSCMERLTPTL